jgi:hypothetical protein
MKQYKNIATQATWQPYTIGGNGFMPATVEIKNDGEFRKRGYVDTDTGA